MFNLLISTAALPHVQLPELLGGEALSELVEPSLVLESVDASKSLCDGEVEDEMGEGEEEDRDPGVSASELGWGLTHPNPIFSGKADPYPAQHRGLISTILTNRLIPILSGLIFASQAAFIQGRNLAHNVNLTQELLCQYNRVNASKRCMLKIDISKAYDMVDWNFLKRIMVLFGFPVKFINWIMACVTTAKFLVLINGKLEDYFSSNRGCAKEIPSLLFSSR
ncbi:hypothetical protein QQ045_002548 [Rhodiola kirilowii]